jgi:hypothetical protein
MTILTSVELRNVQVISKPIMLAPLTVAMSKPTKEQYSEDVEVGKAELRNPNSFFIIFCPAGKLMPLLYRYDG